MSALLRRLCRERLAGAPVSESFDEILLRAEVDMSRRLEEWSACVDAGGDLDALAWRRAAERAAEPPTRALTPREREQCDEAARRVDERLDQLAARAS